MVKSEDAEQIPKISYYWVVPEELELCWKTMAPKKILKKTDSLISDCLRNFVDQYVLVINKVPIGADIGVLVQNEADVGAYINCLNK